MPLDNVVFWVFAPISVASAIGMLLVRNAVHAALFLIVNFFCLAVFFLLLDAPFLFGVQLLLYAGGVVTIVVFAIMLTERLVGQTIRSASRYLVNGAVISAAVFVGIVGFLVQAPPAGVRPALAGDLTLALGRALVGPFALVLELLGVLLVIALVGALYFARSEA